MRLFALHYYMRIARKCANLCTNAAFEHDFIRYLRDSNQTVRFWLVFFALSSIFAIFAKNYKTKRSSITMSFGWINKKCHSDGFLCEEIHIHYLAIRTTFVHARFSGEKNWTKKFIQSFVIRFRQSLEMMSKSSIFFFIWSKYKIDDINDTYRPGQVQYSIDWNR